VKGAAAERAEGCDVRRERRLCSARVGVPRSRRGLGLVAGRGTRGDAAGRAAAAPPVIAQTGEFANPTRRASHDEDHDNEKDKNDTDDMRIML